ncbi:ParA family protein [Candidatus Neptunochlamydia vexilliferae]|uniref:ParA family protein n=1 Tax=Candidatus Neptunichlamydia vexilliferae TaxID=1651774 RepID=A0ABS0AYQ3_9BACT|nr:ParA family protein [Candidatus Neptunochlamydia vexilliferae]MBF5059263.1 ParA family protein [Candidatus Neptunochlamydia vexilliferae]
MKTISVCSFKGGTAKTSISLNLGAALARFHNKRVLMVDFDAQANLTAGLGLDPDNHDSLAAVLQDTKTVGEVIVHTDHPSIDLIPADTWLERVESTGNLATDRYSHEKLKKILAPLGYDFAIIDTPPSLCWLTESSLIACDYGLVCATPEFYSIKGLQRLSYFMHYISERHPFELLGVVLSFWNSRGKNNQEFLEVIEDTFPEKVLNTKVRRDIAVSEASIHGKPVFETRPKSRAAEDFRELTQELLPKLESPCLSSTHS